MTPAPRVLVAGVGNIFLGDDGFGVEVARRLAAEDLPDWVRVADFGIRGVHLAYELLEGYETAILVDAAPRGAPAGTVYVIQPDLDGPGPPGHPVGVPRTPPDAPGHPVGVPRTPPAPSTAAPAEQGVLVDGHGMEPDAVFALLKALGGDIPRMLVVGCEPADTGEGMGLSAPVAGAVGEAVAVVRELIDEHEAGKEG
jgi:hydrogenase maturation protease